MPSVIVQSVVDNILVIENGQLTLEGKHDSLINKIGLYKEIGKKHKHAKG